MPLRIPPPADPAASVSPPGQRRAWPPWRALLTLAGAAALLHALLLAGVTAAETTASAAPQAVAMRVRTLPAAPAQPVTPGDSEAAWPGDADSVWADAAAPTPGADGQTGANRPAGVAATSARARASVPTPTPATHAAARRAAAEQLPDSPAAEAIREAPDTLAAVGAASGPAEGSAIGQPAEPPASSALPARNADAAPALALAMPLPAADATAATAAPLAAPAVRLTGAPTVLAVGAVSTHGSGASEPEPGTDHPPAREDEMPVYKTVLPPPLTLHYDLRRGLLSGSGTLVWRPEADHYEMRLEGRVAGLSVLTQVSQGGFDDAGIAPRRYTDQRLNRAPLAANFNREQGKITFSGPSTEFPLLVGTQDRLSWMIQLAAVVSAEPRRLAPGGKVAIYVVGARADASMWVFRCAGMEKVETAGGTVHAARFTREPRSAHDTLAEAWLDPARHGLPVRARVGTGDGGDAVELSLRELQLP